MEASSLIQISTKKTYEIDLTTLLKAVIDQQYNSADLKVDVTKEINDLMALRRVIVLDGKDEGTLDTLCNYYHQLECLEMKMPEKDVKYNIQFKWKDAFYKGGIFGGNINLVLASLAYEKLCVLFNIGALKTSLACQQNLDSDEGKQLAAKYFQVASGIFQHLSVVVVNINEPLTQDLTPEVLSAISALLVAQAQEIIIKKAINDDKNAGIIAKLCSQCETLYGDTYKQIKQNSYLDREWLNIVSGKQEAFIALAHYYQSRINSKDHKIGEEIARLQYAIENLKKANTKCKGFDKYLLLAKNQLDIIKKDNDMIYHDKIPELNELQNITKAVVAKYIPFQTKMSSDFSDLFDNLLPLTVHKSLLNYHTRKNSIINSEIERLDQSNKKLDSLTLEYKMPPAKFTSLAAQQIRTEFSKIEIMREERVIIERDLKNIVTDNIQDKLLKIWEKSGKIDDSEITLILNTTFGNLQTRVHETIQKQALITVEIQRAGAELKEEIGEDKQCSVM